MKLLISALAFCLSGALAQAETTSKSKAIGGEFHAAFEGFNEFGSPQVRLTLKLTSTLVCPASAPKLTFGVGGGVLVHYVSAPTEEPGAISYGFMTSLTNDGVAEGVTTSIKAGTAFTAIARSATCQCGHRYGEGGYIDLVTAPVAIPPWLTYSPASNFGKTCRLTITGHPRGAETIEVVVSGGGLDEHHRFTPADFGKKDFVAFDFLPAAAGKITATGTLQPAGAAHALTFDVPAPQR